jgi:hypothetical protein
MRMSLVTRLFATVGALVPMALLVVNRMSEAEWWPTWSMYVWPASYMLTATSAMVGRYWYGIEVISIALNILMYAAVGSASLAIAKKCGLA